MLVLLFPPLSSSPPPPAALVPAFIAGALVPAADAGAFVPAADAGVFIPALAPAALVPADATTLVPAPAAGHGALVPVPAPAALAPADAATLAPVPAPAALAPAADALVPADAATLVPVPPPAPAAGAVGDGALGKHPRIEEPTSVTTLGVFTGQSQHVLIFDKVDPRQDPLALIRQLDVVQKQQQCERSAKMARMEAAATVWQQMAPDMLIRQGEERAAQGLGPQQTSTHVFVKAVLHRFRTPLCQQKLLAHCQNISVQLEIGLCPVGTSVSAVSQALKNLASQVVSKEFAPCPACESPKHKCYQLA